MDDRRQLGCARVGGARIPGVSALNVLVARVGHAAIAVLAFVLVTGGVRTDSPHLHY